VVALLCLFSSDSGKWLLPLTPLKELPHRAMESKHRSALSPRNHANATQSSNVRRECQPGEKESLPDISSSKTCSKNPSTGCNIRNTSRNTSTSSKIKNNTSHRNSKLNDKWTNNERWLKRLTIFYQKYCPSKVSAKTSHTCTYIPRQSLQRWLHFYHSSVLTLLGTPTPV